MGSFVGFLLWGRITNPPPYRVVIAVRDIAAHQPLSTEILVVDEELLSPRVAERYVQEHELDLYLDAIPVEPIYAGEPLTKSRLLLAANPAANQRLALALDDPEYLAMVIPVDPTTSVADLYPGDLVNVEFGISFQSTSALLPISSDLQSPTLSDEGDLALPLAKTLFQHLLVLQVNYEQIPNPNYGLGTLSEGSGSTEPAFLRGRIESIVVLIPESEQELLTFALENGTVRIALASPLAATDPLRITPGVTWQDFIARFLGERAASTLEQEPYVVPPSSETPEAQPSPTPSG